MGKVIAVLAFLGTVIVLNLLIPVFNWICNHIDMWTPEVGYLPWILIITSVSLYVYIIKWVKQPD